jgi:hypothetical protein
LIKKIIAILIIYNSYLFSDLKNQTVLPPCKDPYDPWFIGPLFSRTPVNMLPGHPGIEPAIIISNNYGIYNKDWKLDIETSMFSISPVIDYQIGFTKRIGLEVVASIITNIKKNRVSTNFKDTFLYLGFQISNDEKKSWVPDFRLFFAEAIPTGNYNNLNPKKLGTDISGFGSYQSGFAFSVQKQFVIGCHYLNLRNSFSYLFPAPTNVKNTNVFGGGKGTRGKVYPGQNYTIFFSGEYSFSQHWVFAFDTEFEHYDRSTFKGKNGNGNNGEELKVGLPSSESLTFAPGIEYNLAPNMGFLFGTRFSITGRNSSAFLSAFLSLVYIF